MNKPNFKKIINNFIPKIKEKGWYPYIGEYLEEKGNTLLEKLYEKKQKEGITPEFKQLFRAFTTCNFKDLKVIIINDAPYIKKGVADGLAFSSSNTKEIPKELKIIFNEISKSIYNEDYKENPDLLRWSEQGVLLLNISLTRTPDNNNKHFDLWEDFTKNLLINLQTKVKIIYILIGKKAKEAKEHIFEDFNFVLECEHPYVAIKTNEKWKSNDVFYKTNLILKNNYKEPIIW
jgi:uracil-DNA glycosylase